MIEVACRLARNDFRLDVSFRTEARVVALFGPSGSGKSTTLNVVAGLLRPEHGLVRVNGVTFLDTDASVDLPTHRRRIGYVFQDGRLFPHLSVRNNLRFGRWFAKAPAGAAGPDLRTVAELLGIEPLLDRRTATLSGGERQRVAIGRAVLAHPRLLLLDEPFAALDRTRRDEALDWFLRLRDELDLPMLYVSHDPAEVERIADAVIRIEDGRVVGAGVTD